MGANYRKELEAGVPGGSIPSGGGLSKMTDYLVNRKSGYTGIDTPATGEVKGSMRIINPKETVKKAEPLTKQEMRARDKANAEVQKQLPRLPRQSKSYQEEMPEAELAFKKGGKVSSASKRADGCCVRGKTRA